MYREEHPFREGERDVNLGRKLEGGGRVERNVYRA